MSDLMGFMRARENRYRGIGPKKSESVRRRLNLGTAPPASPEGQPVEAKSPILDRSSGQPGGPSTDGVQATGSVGVSGTRIQDLLDNMLKSNQDFYRQQEDKRRISLMEQLLAPGQNNQILPPTLAPLGTTGNQQVPTGSNGRLDMSTMVNVDGEHYLAPAAAQAWLRMVQAAAADGITLTIGNSYRTFEEQVALAEEKGLYSQGGLAAEPGTSRHGMGTAVDVGEGAQRQWLAENAGQFGFVTIPREPWHWQYEG